MNILSSEWSTAARAALHWRAPMPPPRLQTPTDRLLAATATLLLLSQVTPQVGFFGRGFRTTLPCFAILLGWGLLYRWRGFCEGVRHFKRALFLGFLFAAQAFFRFMLGEESRELWQMGVLTPLLILLACLLFHVLSTRAPKVMTVTRQAGVLLWSVLLALGLPALIATPGVARLTMGNDQVIANTAIWAPLGVGEFSIYTSFAICSPLLLVVTLRMKGAMRLLGLVAFTGACVAVLLSTFTMAYVLLVVGLGVGLVQALMNLRGPKKIVGMALLSVTILGGPLANHAAQSLEQFEFVSTKLNRLQMGITGKGLANGDETERGAWFVEEMSKSLETPLLGYIPSIQGDRGHGHSSFSNSLMLYGYPGALIWLLALASVFRRCFGTRTSLNQRLPLATSWLLLMISGILNPTWHSLPILLPLILLSLHVPETSN